MGNPHPSFYFCSRHCEPQSGEAIPHEIIIMHEIASSGFALLAMTITVFYKE
jgi:hypothetical protein